MKETINNKLFKIIDLENIVILDDCDDDFIDDISNLNLSIPKGDLSNLLEYIKTITNSIDTIDTCDSLTINLSNEMVEAIRLASFFEDIEIEKEDLFIDAVAIDFNFVSSVTSISFQFKFREINAYAEFEVEIIRTFD